MAKKPDSSGCTCTWSLVNTTTEDPPHITHVDPACWMHGDNAPDWWALSNGLPCVMDDGTLVNNEPEGGDDE